MRSADLLIVATVLTVILALAFIVSARMAEPQLLTRVAIPPRDAVPRARWSPVVPDWLPAPLSDLCRRVLSDDRQPQWKRDAVGVALSGEAASFTARVTAYCAGHPDVDPAGGEFATTSGRTPRRGLCAADWRHYPNGTVLFLGPPFRELSVVADTGGAVKGPRHLDYCTTTHADFRAAEALPGRGAVKVWVLGRVGREVK
jgi:3D (Asp-Asp-Asp) domain-containing protein